MRSLEHHRKEYYHKSQRVHRKQEALSEEENSEAFKLPSSPSSLPGCLARRLFYILVLHSDHPSRDPSELHASARVQRRLIRLSCHAKPGREMFSHLSSLDTPARLLVAWLDIHYVGLGRRAELDFRVCDEIPKQEELPPEEDTAAPEVRCSACDLGFASSAAFREHVKSSSHVERVSELWRSSLGSSEAPKDPGLGEEGLEYLRGHDFGEQQADDSLSVFFHGTLSNSAPSLLHQMLRDLAVQSPEPRNHSARAVEWRVSRKLNDPGPSVPKRRKGKQTQSQPSSSGSQGSASIVLKCWRAPLDISSYQTRHPHLARCSGCAYRVALWEWFGIEALGLRPGLERRHWAVLMAHGGRFAGGIFDMYGGKPIPQIALLQKESADVGLELTLPGKGESSAWAPVPLRSSNAGDEDEETEESSSDEDDPFEDEGKAEDTSPKVVVSGDITNLTSFFCPRVLRHKTFSKYVVRKKQGRVQWQADGQRGSSIQSAGAMVRRRNFEQFVAKLNSLLQEWAEELRRCERVFLVAPSYNREILLAEGTPLVGDNVRFCGLDVASPFHLSSISQ